ncbi:MAG: hypothetical protein A2Z83_05170 [Omnitrophica bacterium GWA2_52_8]|nr:MAG: hypothetical protein A2Z83_05170 [Omnitrophica bacterium GWA2_52_8]
MHTGVLIPRRDDRVQNVMMNKPVSDLLTGKDLLVASPTDSIAKVVEIFQKEKKNCVLVYDNHRLVGILSNRDILLKVAGYKTDLSKVSVESIMTRNPEYVRPDAPLAFVVNKMAMGGFRQVPVIDSSGKPLSIITIKDVMSHLSKTKNG